MKHPIEEQNKVQEAFLKQLPAKDRTFHRRLFNIGNASLCYHQLAKENEPTEQEFNEWLEGLPEPIRSNMAERGFESCKTAMPFTRYVLERGDIGMDEWMKKNLSKSDYKEYSKNKVDF